MQALEIDSFLPPKQQTIRVCALHAFAYCPRLFYLEEVEELHTQDAAVFAGRRLHAELEKQEDEEWEELYLESEELGLRGRLDALRTRDGETIPYEHKRGRCHRDAHNQPQAWESDRLQILSYAWLIELAKGISVPEGRCGEQIKISRRHQPTEILPGRQIGQIVLHSFSQISTQALYFCTEQAIGIHFVSGGGRYVGSFDARGGSIQRRIRQYAALSNSEKCLELARKLVICRGQGQRKFLMRGGRGKEASEELKKAINQMKIVLAQVPKAKGLENLLGLEGNLAALYFGALPYLIGNDVSPLLHFCGRNRRPPKDRFNALLSFGYALLLKDVMNAILSVGLEPALGFYHQPRSQASPLALDLMEIFRVPLVDMVVMGSINRGQWQPQTDFEVRGEQVWLSDAGRRRIVDLYESRKQETWKHPVTGYSLTYRRLLELEVRLLEKEWMGEGGLFGQLIVR